MAEQAAAAANGGVVRTTGLPAYADVEALSTAYSEVQFLIRRQNARMQWLSVVGNITIPPMEILDMEAIVRRMAGGGNYQVDVYEPGTKKPLLAFTLALEGAPIVTPTTPVPGGSPGTYGPAMGPPTVNATMPQMPLPAAQLPPPPPGFTWMQTPHGTVLTTQGATSAGPPEAPRTSIPSDEMALRQVSAHQKEIAELKKDIVALQAKVDSEREKAAMKYEQLQDKHDAFVEASKERERKLENAAFEARTEARIAAATKGNGGGGMEGIAALAAALAPVATGLMTSSRDQAIAQQNTQTAIIQSALKPREDATGAALLMKLLDQKDPKHQIDAMDAAAQSQMAMFGMMSQIVNMVQQTQPPDSPMMGLLTQMLMSAGGMLDKWMEKKQQVGGVQDQPRMIDATVLPPRAAPAVTQPAPQPQQQAAPQPQHASAPAPTSAAPPSATYNPNADDDEEEDDDGDDVEAAPSNGAANGNGHSSNPATNAVALPTQNQLAQQVVAGFIASPEVPAAFKTPDWRDLIFRIHALLDVKTVAARFVTLLRGLKRRNQLPPVLADLFTNPEERITNILAALPIVQMDRDYATQLRDLVVDELLADARNSIQAPPS